MQQNQNTSLVLSLIKDDLINNKLINGLNTLGLSAGDYHLHLSETILNLIGLDTESDAIHAYISTSPNKANPSISPISPTAKNN